MDLIRIAKRIASSSFSINISMQIELKPVENEDGTENIFEVYIDGENQGNILWSGLEFQSTSDDVPLPDSVMKKLSGEYLNSMI